MSDWLLQTGLSIVRSEFFNDWINVRLIAAMCQRIAVIFVIAFLFSKSKSFELLVKNHMARRDWVMLYGIFFFISSLGSLIGDQVTIEMTGPHWTGSAIVRIEPALFAADFMDQPELATTQVEARAVGALLAGILGGPALGAAVGISSGAVRYLMGGDVALAGALGTALAGLTAGLVYLRILRIRHHLRFNWKIAFCTACVVELVMKCLVLLTNQPFYKAYALIQVTAIPNTLGNAIGAALFVSIVSDYDRNAAAFSTNALRMAEFFANVLKRDLPKERKVARIARFIHRETGVAAVALSDQSHIIAFDGMGADHHRAGDSIVTEWVKTALDRHQIIFIDGYRNRFHCEKSRHCPLHSLLIAPVFIQNEVEGALLLFESRQRIFPKLNHALGKGLASLLSEQILASRYPALLAQVEDQYLRARIDPHFFTNALTTISAVTRNDPGEARALMRKLANLMRERVSPDYRGHTLRQELAFLNDYIDIEKARFDQRLHIDISAEQALLDMVMPQLVLQLLVENAIRHGVSRLSGCRRIEVNAYLDGPNRVRIDVKDNAGLFRAEADGRRVGFGMKLADDLIKSQFDSDEYGLTVHCEADQYTVVTVTLPFVLEQK